MANLAHFDQKAIDAALEAAHRSAQKVTANAPATHQTALAQGTLKLGAQCISLTVQNGQVCLSLPLGIGDVCLPIPNIFPNGTAAQACLDICTVWGVPCGVEVTVTIAGQRVVSQHWGCSC